MRLGHLIIAGRPSRDAHLFLSRCLLPTSSEAERLLGLTPGAAMAYVAALEKDGYIERDTGVMGAAIRVSARGEALTKLQAWVPLPRHEAERLVRTLVVLAREINDGGEALPVRRLEAVGPYAANAASYQDIAICYALGTREGRGQAEAGRRTLRRLQDVSPRIALYGSGEIVAAQRVTLFEEEWLSPKNAPRA